MGSEGLALAALVGRRAALAGTLAPGTLFALTLTLAHSRSV